MKVKYLTCGGLTEQTNIDSVLKLAEKYPLAEFAVGISTKINEPNDPRFEWLMKLVERVRQEGLRINLSIRLSMEATCTFIKDYFSPQMRQLFSCGNKNAEPIFGRVKLDDIIIKAEQIRLLRQILKNNPAHRFILPCTEKNQIVLSTLYDESHVMFDVIDQYAVKGDELEAEKNRPTWEDILQGLGGDISAENVKDVLAEAKKQYPFDEIYLEAEKGLQDEKGNFSVEKAELFLEQATEWISQNPM